MDPYTHYQSYYHLSIPTTHALTVPFSTSPLFQRLCYTPSRNDEHGVYAPIQLQDAFFHAFSAPSSSSFSQGVPITQCYNLISFGVNTNYRAAAVKTKRDITMGKTTIVRKLTKITQNEFNQLQQHLELPLDIKKLTFLVKNLVPLPAILEFFGWRKNWLKVIRVSRCEQI